MQYIFKLLYSAILAGVCIGIGGTVYLRVGGPLGAVLFTIGLIAVVSYGLKLYTGTAGFVTSRNWWELLPILVGNIVGCWLMSLLPTGLDVASIVANRGDSSLLDAFLLAIGCGFLMTTAVTFARQGKWLPLLFSVPVFILCGFYHCIADAFYYAVGMQYLTWHHLPVYIATVLGNFVGCNVPRYIPKF